MSKIRILPRRENLVVKELSQTDQPEIFRTRLAFQAENSTDISMRLCEVMEVGSGELEFDPNDVYDNVGGYVRKPMPYVKGTILLVDNACGQKLTVEGETVYLIDDYDVRAIIKTEE